MEAGAQRAEEPGDAVPPGTGRDAQRSREQRPQLPSHGDRCARLTGGWLVRAPVPGWLRRWQARRPASHVSNMISRIGGERARPVSVVFGVERGRGQCRAGQPREPLSVSEPFLWWPCWLFFRIGNAVCPSHDPIRKPRIKVRVSEGLRGERSTLGVKTFPGNKSLPLPLPSAKELERHGGGAGGSVGGARQSGFPGDLI